MYLLVPHEIREGAQEGAPEPWPQMFALQPQAPVCTALGRWQNRCGCFVVTQIIFGSYQKGAALFTGANFSENKAICLILKLLIRVCTWYGQRKLRVCFFSCYLFGLYLSLHIKMAFLKSCFFGLNLLDSIQTHFSRSLWQPIWGWLSVVTQVDIASYLPSSFFAPYHFIQSGNVFREGVPSPREWSMTGLIHSGDSGFFDWLRSRHMTQASQRRKGVLISAGDFWSRFPLLPSLLIVTTVCNTWCYNSHLVIMRAKPRESQRSWNRALVLLSSHIIRTFPSGLLVTWDKVCPYC